METTFITTTLPKCHPGIMALFNWCEQSDCRLNCTCRTKKVCKQICEQKQCGNLYCNSTETCHQSVLVNHYLSVPKVKLMTSSSPITQQDCSQGRCQTLEALRYKNKFTTVFQSCSEGTCGHIKSNGDQVKQFCGNCETMTCNGKHSQNCTQLCILGQCKKVKCSSKYCKQLCSHESTCDLECDSSTDICHQECTHGSTCNFKCKAKQCNYVCDKASTCTYENVTKTQVVIKPTLVNTTTTKKLNTTTTTQVVSTVRTSTMSNNVDDQLDKQYIDIVHIENNTIVTSANLRSSSSISLYANHFLSALLLFLCIYAQCTTK